MENLAPQSNENNKCINVIVGQETFDFDKHLDDSGMYTTLHFIIFLYFFFKVRYLHIRVEKKYIFII